jgi:phage FluMu protein gp41
MDTLTPTRAADTAATAPPARIDDLYTLVLADGLPVELEGQPIRYRTVRLRETTVADEREAERLSERAILVSGSYKLLISESNFKHVLNMLHIESFHCDGEVIGRSLISLDLYDKLSVRDLELLEQRIFLLTLAAEVRYGNMTQAEFDELAAGIAPKGQAPSPQPVGQATAVGQAGLHAESGPALLTDYLGAAAQGQAQSAGAATV